MRFQPRVALRSLASPGGVRTKIATQHSRSLTLRRRHLDCIQPAREVRKRRRNSHHTRRSSVNSITDRR